MNENPNSSGSSPVLSQVSHLVTSTELSKLDLFLTNFKDYHIPVALFVFIVGSLIHWFHRLDAAFITFTSTVLTFLGTHAIFSPESRQ